MNTTHLTDEKFLKQHAWDTLYLTKIVESLRNALEPFAKLGKLYDNTDPHDKSGWALRPDSHILLGNTDVATVTVGDLRAAYNLLRPDSKTEI